MKVDDADMALTARLMEPDASMTPQDKPSGLTGLVRRAWQSWATRSLAVGAVATAIDVLVLLVCVKLFTMANPLGAMVGVLFGSTFTFFANKYFAFRDHNPGVAPQAAKFVVVTFIGMQVHAAFVWVFADKLGVPVVLAKFGADILVFSVGQLLVMRYIIFPKKPAAPVAAESATQPLPAATRIPVAVALTAGSDSELIDARDTAQALRIGAR